MKRLFFVAASLLLAASMSLPARSSQSSAFLPGGSFDSPTDIAVDASGRAFLAIVLDRANDVLDVRLIDHGRNERIEGVAEGGPGILYLIGSAEASVPPNTPCCYSDRDAYVTTIR